MSDAVLNVKFLSGEYMVQLKNGLFQKLTRGDTLYLLEKNWNFMLLKHECFSSERQISKKFENRKLDGRKGKRFRHK
jgi:hypothetical protein